MLTGWVVLQTYEERGKIGDGVMQLEMVTSEANARSHGWALGVLQITST
jgi:hypothetical protein